MHDGDAAAAVEHVTDDVTLWSPILPDPFEGKAKVQWVLGALSNIVDKFDVIDVMHGASHVAIAFRFTAGDHIVEGMDLLTLDAEGMISTLKVLWRPLPTIVAMQNLIAPSIGAPVLKLVPATAAAA